MSSTWQAYCELLRLEYSICRKDFPAIYERVRQTPVAAGRTTSPNPAAIAHSVDLAAVFYFKNVLCLQRSAATVHLLKRYGFPAQLVIGVQHLPFAAHAWVELEGAVINDKPYMSEMYSVLERC